MPRSLREDVLRITASLAGFAVPRQRHDSRALPVRNTIHHDTEDYLPVFHQDLEPRAGALLRKVDAAEAEARNQMAESIGRRRVGNLSNRALGVLRTISMGPSVLDFLMHFRNAHF